MSEMPTESTATPDKTTVSQLSFEEALQELEGIVRALESGDTSLENAISQYERGTMLKKHCEQKLADARMKVDQVTFDAPQHAQHASETPSQQAPDEQPSSQPTMPFQD
mgnify:CR=1 FL=1